MDGLLWCHHPNYIKHKTLDMLKALGYKETKPGLLECPGLLPLRHAKGRKDTFMLGYLVPLPPPLLTKPAAVRR